MSSIHYCILRVAWTHEHPTHYLQGKLGLNYDDPVAVNEETSHSWWLADESCKYILSVLVHKDNKDLSTRPTKQPVGRMGRDEYERRLVNLANQMPGMMEQTPQGDDLFTP